MKLLAAFRRWLNGLFPDSHAVPRCTDCGQPVGPDAVAVNGHLYHPYFCVEYRDAA